MLKFILSIVMLSSICIFAHGQTVIQGTIQGYYNKPIKISVLREDSARMVNTDNYGRFKIDLKQFSFYEAIISWDNHSFHVFSAPPDIVNITADNKRFKATLMVDGAYYFRKKNTKFEFVNNDSINRYEDIARIAPDKIRIVELWAVVCSPCLVQQKMFKKYDSKLDSLGIKKLFISYDNAVNPGSKPVWNRCIQSNDLQGYHLLANQQLYDDLSKKHGYAAIPQYFLIDKHNQIYPVQFATKPPKEPVVTYFERELAKLYKLAENLTH